MQYLINPTMFCYPRQVLFPLWAPAISPWGRIWYKTRDWLNISSGSICLTGFVQHNPPRRWLWLWAIMPPAMAFTYLIICSSSQFRSLLLSSFSFFFSSASIRLGGEVNKDQAPNSGLISVRTWLPRKELLSWCKSETKLSYNLIHTMEEKLSTGMKPKSNPLGYKTKRSGVRKNAHYWLLVGSQVWAVSESGILTTLLKCIISNCVIATVVQLGRRGGIYSWTLCPAFGISQLIIEFCKMFLSTGQERTTSPLTVSLLW